MSDTATKPPPVREDSRSVTWSALRAAFGRTPLWLLTGVAPLGLAFILALPWHAWFGEAAAGYAPGAQLHHLDQNFRTDHGAEMASLSQATRRVASGLVLVEILLSLFFAGGWLQVFLERTHGRSVQRFFFGGARHFGRFLRVLFLFLVGASALDWLLHGSVWESYVLADLFGINDGDKAFESVAFETTVIQLGWLRGGLHLVGLSLLFVWADYTRTRLAMHDTRSALVAGFITFFTLLRHPIRCLRPMLLLVAIEFVLLVVLGFISNGMESGLDADTGRWAILVIGACSLLAILCGKILRGARYAAALQVSRGVAPPMTGASPWSQTIGGPGGPQYPIVGAEDDYGVSL